MGSRAPSSLLLLFPLPIHPELRPSPRYRPLSSSWRLVLPSEQRSHTQELDLTIVTATLRSVPLPVCRDDFAFENTVLTVTRKESAAGEGSFLCLPLNDETCLLECISEMVSPRLMATLLKTYWNTNPTLEFSGTYFCQHRTFLSFSPLTIANPVLQASAQVTVIMRSLHVWTSFFTRQNIRNERGNRVAGNESRYLLFRSTASTRSFPVRRAA